MGRPPKQTSLFWRETRQRILGHEISPYPEVVRGREWQLTTRPREGSWRLESREEVGGWRAERQLAAGQQRGKQQKAVGAGQQGELTTRPSRGQLRLDSREARQHGIGSSDSESRWVWFQSIVEFSLVTHASDSLHMHVVLHTFLCSWLTPSFVCSFVLLFSPFPRSYSCVGKEMCVTPSNH